MKGHTCYSLKKQREFLVTFLETATILHAAVVGISRQTHCNWLDHDPEYAAAFEDAKETAIESLEKEARRRAVDGLDDDRAPLHALQLRPHPQNAPSDAGTPAMEAGVVDHVW